MEYTRVLCQTLMRPYHWSEAKRMIDFLSMLVGGGGGRSHLICKN